MLFFNFLFDKLTVRKRPSTELEEEKSLPSQGSELEEEKVIIRPTRPKPDIKNTNRNTCVIPVTILSKIIEFLDLDDRKTISLVSQEFRKINRNVSFDLTSEAVGYDKLVKFLRVNYDLKITGIKLYLEHSDRDLSGLKPYLKNIKKIVIGGKFVSNELCSKMHDYLEECVNLEDCEIKDRGKIFPCLPEDNKLKRLSFSFCEKKGLALFFSNLEYLNLRGTSRETLDLRWCPSLTKLDIGKTKFTKIELSNNNQIKDLCFKPSVELDMSFLSKCNNVSRLKTARGILDLNVLDQMNSLTELVILDPRGFYGDLTKLAKLRYLNLSYYTNDRTIPLGRLPEMPPNLEHFKLQLNSRCDNFMVTSLEVLEKCSKLEKLQIKGSRFNIIYIGKCATLKYVDIDLGLGIIEGSKSLGELKLLTNLRLCCGNTSLNSEMLSGCTELKSLSLTVPDLENANFLNLPQSLEFLEISIEDTLDLVFLANCNSLRNIVFGTYSITNYECLKNLPNLEKIYFYNDEINPSILEMLGDKIGKWDYIKIFLGNRQREIYGAELEDKPE